MAVRLFRLGSFSVGGLLRAIPLDQVRWALVTSLDSSDAPISILRRSQGPDFARDVAGMAVLNASELRTAVATPGLFTHFDEVWLFEREPVEVPNPEWSIVFPAELSEDEVEAVGVWMDQGGCLAGLGDGDGLTALVADRASDLIRSLERMKCWPDDQPVKGPENQVARANTLAALETLGTLDRLEEGQRAAAFDGITAAAGWVFDDDGALASQLGITLYSEEEVRALQGLRAATYCLYDLLGEDSTFEDVVSHPYFVAVMTSAAYAAEVMRRNEPDARSQERC